MPEDDQERTEQPSSRRREQAREEGRVAVSREVSSLFIIMGGLLILWISGLWMYNGMAEVMRKSFSTLSTDMTPSTFAALFKEVGYSLFMILLPAMFIPLFGAAAYVLQNGLMLTSKPLSPDFSRINPLEGFKRIASWSSVNELVKSIIKLGVIGYVVYGAVASEWTNLPFLMDMEVSSAAVYVGDVTLRIMTRTVWVLAVIAILDYAFQRWNFEQSLKMSKQEIKEESKETEGDPFIKARIRSIQRSMSRRRMMQEVPKADFVVTNPTHLAVALRYDRENGGAPVVVAKGAGAIAARIREIAREHGVPVLENKPLARSLFKLVEIGQEIPASLYKAVAEMLAYVYSLKQRAVR